MRNVLPVAGLRLREALAARTLWLLPIHFALAFAAARAMPGPTPEARIEAADATALALAAVLGLVAATVMGAGPLAEERERARGAMLLGAPISPTTRVLGTFLGTGAALLLLVAALCASAMAAVDFGAGIHRRGPETYIRAVELGGGEPDTRDPELVWTSPKADRIFVRFPRRLNEGERIELHARPRVAAGGVMTAWKRAEISFGQASWKDASGSVDRRRVERASLLMDPIRFGVEVGCDYLVVMRVEGNFELGLRKDGVRLSEVNYRDIDPLVDVDPRDSRVLARSLHAAALGAGLLAALAAAMALSTVAGTGVAAAGALTLATLALFRSTFVDAASMLASAGAMERAIEAANAGAQVHAEAQTMTPPAFAPLFRALAAVLPDGTRFNLASAIAANEVPDAGDATRAVLLGAAVAALFLLLCVFGARRRP